MKPSIPKGTRDFGPETMIKRNFILSTIKAVFEKYGFPPIETPTMENLSVLTGKYGNEGDQLIFKILNSGDFLSKTEVDDYKSGSKELLPKIAEKGLRYDLTVPFARFVVMNRNDITLPFKRYQTQPVWRADRPQRGRYREFYQCDADVVGTDSLLCEAEIVMMVNDAMNGLGIKNFEIKYNNRKILTAIAEVIGAAGKEAELCVAIDKLDKIGWDKVADELIGGGFTLENTKALLPFINLKGSNLEILNLLKNNLKSSSIGLEGCQEIERFEAFCESFGREKISLVLDTTLARGLSYYTGTIFELKSNDVAIGSIGGGGRYDNLTGVFGMNGLSGVGISFGVDRIYDVMSELNLFPEAKLTNTTVLLAPLDNEIQLAILKLADKLRMHNIKTEVYPDAVKIAKQFQFADKKGIPYVLVVGSEEIKSQKYTLKNMVTGEQKQMTDQEIIDILVK
jgi:histidyl-tRNA synthetase